MGVAQGINMQFGLKSLIPKVHGLEELSGPFTQEEIDEVLKSLPVDRAPGPGGFSSLFVKWCWSIIKNDFLNLMQDFL